jgi:hypothetical protein
MVAYIVIRMYLRGMFLAVGIVEVWNMPQILFGEVHLYRPPCWRASRVKSLHSCRVIKDTKDRVCSTNETAQSENV